MNGQAIDYESGGTAFRGMLFAPAGGPHPGVLLFPAGRGMDQHVLTRAAALADEGFAVLAADYHGGGQPLASADEAMAQASMLRGNPLSMRSRAGAALAALAARPEVDPRGLAAAGFCLGGSMALELARSGAAIAAVAVFHGELATRAPAKPGAVHAAILVFTGSLDPTVPPDQIVGFLAEMDEAGADAEVRSYSGTRHAFTNPDAGGHPAMAHHPASDRRAWQSLAPFLKTRFDSLETLHGHHAQAAG